MAELQTTLSTSGSLSASLGAGKIIFNDYTITLEQNDDGGVLTAVKGSQTQTITISNGAQGAQGIQGEKGEKGDQGAQGEKGADGTTPVRGTDYWTDIDKSEIVNDVLAALPTWAGGAY